ncbi:MAG: uracil-DNA glycosylase [Candidatus Zixiibacteriota bacterium]|nr:MAG: uracil-DNA glycosylase [candidate division Zixibacteria bacterium]
MKDNNGSLSDLIRRALASQIDLGLGEAIVGRTRSSAAEMSFGQPQVSKVVSVVDLFDKPAAQSAPQFPSLTAHREAVCNCQLCPLGQTRNKFVYGVGHDRAEVMFIGEAPGAEEDRLGEPFVGRAGQLLDKILAAIQLSRQQVYIANILKCRPPGNRDPIPDEMNKCFPYLKEQIRIIRPKIICALGRVAAQALLGTSTPLGKLRKRWHEYEGVPMIITYHPAALLRFPAYKKDTWEDVQMLRARLDELK